MAKDYSEDLLIQHSTAEFLEQELGWKSVYAFDSEVLGEQGTLSRKSQHEVVLTRHLRMALNILQLRLHLTDLLLAHIPVSRPRFLVRNQENRILGQDSSSEIRKAES